MKEYFVSKSDKLSKLEYNTCKSVPTPAGRGRTRRGKGLSEKGMRGDLRSAV